MSRQVSSAEREQRKRINDFGGVAVCLSVCPPSSPSLPLSPLLVALRDRNDRCFLVAFSWSVEEGGIEGGREGRKGTTDGRVAPLCHQRHDSDAFGPSGVRPSATVSGSLQNPPLFPTATEACSIHHKPFIGWVTSWTNRYPPFTG